MRSAEAKITCNETVNGSTGLPGRCLGGINALSLPWQVASVRQDRDPRSKLDLFKHWTPVGMYYECTVVLCWDGLTPDDHAPHISRHFGVQRPYLIAACCDLTWHRDPTNFPSLNVITL
jgi:hypothetical protein